MYVTSENQDDPMNTNIDAGNQQIRLFPAFINFKQTKRDKISQRLQDIRIKAFQEIESICEFENGAEKVYIIFVKESKDAIQQKLDQFEKKIEIDLFPISEIFDNLQKLEENMINSIRQGVEDLRKKLEINGYSPDSPSKEEMSIEQNADLKKRKKIPHKAVSVLKEWLIEHVQDPYPSNEVKEELAKKTNLNVKQIIGSQLVYKRKRQNLEKIVCPRKVWKPCRKIVFSKC